MNSFRVKDTRFRILKGGKIGLAFSIALIGGMLILSSTKANATDYFTGTSTVISPLTSGSVTVETATNTKTNGNNTDTRSDTSSTDVIFAPTSWANSNYIPTSISSDYYGIGQDAYKLNQTSDYLKLELTFASGANANNITKQGATLYTAPVAPTYVPVSSTSTYSLTQTPSSIDYTANLIFQGNNTVSGYTAISDGNIKLNGDNIAFNGTVNAGSIDVTAVGTTTFNNAVDVSSGSVDDLKFSAAGTVILNSDLTGNVVTTGNNQGILTTTGLNKTITGNIGSSTSLDLNTLNIGSDTDVTNYSTTTINGNVFSNSTVLNNNGTTNSSELILASGKNITSTITTADANMGILTLAGGTQTVSGQVGTNGNKLAEVNAGVNGSTSTFANDVYATNLDVEGTGTVNLDGNFTGTAIRYNADGTVILADTKNINSAITTSVDNTGTLSLEGSSTVTGQVGASGASLKEINAGVAGSTSTFNSNVYASNLNMTGTGTVILNSDLTGNVVATGNNQGILTTTGLNKTITGNIGSSTSLDLNTLNIGSDTDATNYSTTTINGNVFANSTVLNNNGTTNSSELILASGKNITSTITTADANMGILTLAGGTQTVTGTVGGVGASLEKVSSGATGATSTFVNNVYANTVENTGTGATTFQDNVVATNVNVNAGTSTFQDNLTATTTTISTGTGNFNTVSGTTTSNLQFTNNGTANLNTGLTGNVITTADNKGTLNLVGSNNQTVTGTVGGVGASLAEVNAGVNGSTSTFANDVYATDITVGNGTVNFEDNVVATTTTIGAGTANFNTTSGTTTTDIVFSNIGTANLLTGLTGDINFSGNNGIVNISDGMGILGSVQTLATNNTGIVNFKGDGIISDSIGSNIYGIKELNINTNNEQNTPNGVLVTYDALGRELYADVVSLRNNATLTLADGVDIINTGSDNIIITVDNTNTGTLTFQGTSNIEGEVGQSNKVLNTINAGATGKTVTFDDMVYASTLKYSDNGKVVLNGDNSSNTSSEGMIGTVNFDNKAGTLAIGDDVNLTVGAGGTQFINGNDAILEFAGSSIITGILGGNTAGNSTFKRINAGANGETVTFRNDVYVNETTFHVSGTGTVNFQGNLISSLIYDADGVVNVSDGKNIVVSSVPVAVTTATTNTGSLNFLGTTLLATDIGTSTKRLKNVTFGSAGSSASTYTQELTKNIYAQNTYIGNGTNQTILEMKNDIIFGGSLTVRANSALDVNTRDITVNDNLSLAANSLTGFKIYTSDITATGSSTGVPSGSITTDTLTIDNNAIIKVNYVGTLYGAGSYNLVSANSILGTYYGTEANGKVSDNSIIDSIIKVDGNNLILFADRTGGGSYGVEDLYIKKSEIGQHYSNGASEALAGYAYDTVVREGALGDVITRIEELDGGLILSSEKKAQMVEMQKLLAPVANNSSIQSSITASNLVLTTIKDRMADMRVSSSTDFIPYGYSGYSSGTYTLNNSLWIKAMGSKATQSKVEDYDGYESTTVGFVAGLDRTLRNGTTIGLAVAQATTKIDQTDFRSGDSSDTQSIQFSTYGSRDFGDTYVDGILSYAKHSTDSTRTANSGKLTSSSDADQISAKVEVGHRVYFEDLATLTPFASLEYGNLNQKGYTEKGTAYQNDALKVDSVKMNKGTLGVGAKLSTNLNVGDNVVIPEFKLAAYNAIGDSNADIKAQYTGGGNQFVTPTQELNKTVYNAGIGVKTTLSESTSLMLGVDYDRSKDGNFEGYSGNVSFRLSF
ncbi:autotransporter domain-containing protein [Arcobacter suis]|uniref:autotransporter domain-containing protein n=1 Tax=Arcobacter suis TaxID=1278212 RepID=UPI0039EF06F5